MLDIVFSKNVEGSLVIDKINDYNNIFTFSLGLGVGRLLNPLSELRIESLEPIFENLEYELNYIKRDQEKAIVAMDKLLERLRNDSSEIVRIWYSSEINEFVGLGYIIDVLSKEFNPMPEIRLMCLPNYLKVKDAIHIPEGWNEVAAEYIPEYLGLEEVANKGFIMYAKMTYEALVMDDKLLRVKINGNVESVELDFFDYFIKKEIKEMGEEFDEANLIVRVITKYHFGISDAFIAYRINEMVKQGELTVISVARFDEPSYRRVLKQN